jgi:hypothetical protein
MWKQLKAAGQAANEAAARDNPPATGGPSGFFGAVSTIIAQSFEPQVVATAALRGAPLPGSDDSVIDGSAWIPSLDSAVAVLRTRDSAFDPALLVRFAEQVFTAVAAVWTGASAATVRPVMSDDLWEPLAAATGSGTAIAAPAMFLGQRLDQHGQSARARLSGLFAGDWYDSALVSYQVTPALQSVPQDTTPTVAEWEEEWLYQRSVQPGGNPMARPETCPSCGAPTETDEHDRCVYCQQTVPYLTTGWLAVRIVSHNPAQQTAHDEMLEKLRSNPAAYQRLPPAVRKLLPPDIQNHMSRQPPTGP